jgi:hypothetical protein
MDLTEVNGIYRHVGAELTLYKLVQFNKWQHL